jgi:hypothetical protein
VAAVGSMAPAQESTTRTRLLVCNEINLKSHMSCCSELCGPVHDNLLIVRFKL